MEQFRHTRNISEKSGENSYEIFYDYATLRGGKYLFNQISLVRAKIKN